MGQVLSFVSVPPVAGEAPSSATVVASAFDQDLRWLSMNHPIAYDTLAAISRELVIELSRLHGPGIAPFTQEGRV